MTGEDGKVEEIEAKNIVIATGSDVAGFPASVEIDEKVIVSSTGALSLRQGAGALVVIGGGVIGLELGSVWARLGAKVTVVEYLDRILAGMDGEVAKQFQRMLAKQGIDLQARHQGHRRREGRRRARVTFEPVKGGAAETIEADVVLVAIGRRPYTDRPRPGRGRRRARQARPGQDRRHFRTNVPGVYAIGDVIAGPMLAHKAEDEGVAVAEIIAGQAGHVNYDVIPSVVYTSPEVASVGKTEEELKEAGIDYKVGKFPFSANGRARASCTTDGFVKILADKATDRVLGVPHRRLRRRRDDPRGCRADGVRRLVGGPGPHLPRPSDHVGGGQGGGARRPSSSRSISEAAGSVRLARKNGPPKRAISFRVAFPYSLTAPERVRGCAAGAVRPELDSAQELSHLLPGPERRRAALAPSLRSRRAGEPALPAPSSGAGACCGRQRWVTAACFVGDRRVVRAGANIKYATTASTR